MSIPARLAELHTDLTGPELEHLRRLLGSWSILADLSFSDLLLVVPTEEAAGAEDGTSVRSGDEGEPEGALVVLGQIRPNNRSTLIEQDLVGRMVDRSAWSLSAAALARGEIVRGTVHHPMVGEAVPVENVPVRFRERVIAAIVRVYSRETHRPISMYEKNYQEVFERLVDMVSHAAFPFPEEDVGTEETPRVGDGFVLVDAEGRVEFASPNAMNAFHRMGVHSPPEGRRFTEIGIEESAVEWALATGRPVVEEVERRPDVVVLVHCIPLLAEGSVTGAVILLRDVTDVRRLDRLLLSKDAAIREVHHRVKNNLQTISSLLSLQARRVAPGEGREALREAERRVRSIALVHEILSRDPGDQVPFGEIVSSLVRMAEDSVVTPRRVEISVRGDLGEVTADVATPLAVILAELLQNAVEHAFVDGPGGTAGSDHGEGANRPPAGRPGHVRVELEHGLTGLHVRVGDDGRGLQPGFDIERTTSLGLSIVRDLVTGQLGGTIRMDRADGGGTEVVLTVPTG